MLWKVKSFYFSTPASLPTESGLYIILNGTSPIYVGKAEDLNKRLNTENGSRDQFANPQRSSDIEGNFIKNTLNLA
ncbi:MAG: GIY-YIG nuclease family protein [Thermodesulfobacteriota bacterium]